MILVSTVWYSISLSKKFTGEGLFENRPLPGLRELISMDTHSREAAAS
jgi:hypothetical protein